MAKYKERKNYVPHNINNTTVTIDDVDIVEALDSVEFEMVNDETSIETSADGVAVIVENPSRVGTCKLVFLEPSATSKVLWDLVASGNTFSLAASDTATPEMRVSAKYCRVVKAPALSRGASPDKPEWTITSGYMDIKGSSYSLAE
ncbi:MAG: hypothetical protein GY847_28860 [Proteobacteria bacterium]|nr:hypothetical protein [Pseudomonadota bacterium]